MKIKPSKIEQGFLIGLAVGYLRHKSGKGFVDGMVRVIMDRGNRASKERARIVDPYNRVI